MLPTNPAVCTTLQCEVNFNYLPTRPVGEEDKHLSEGRPMGLRNAVPTEAQPQHGGVGGAPRPLVLTPGWAVDPSGSQRRLQLPSSENCIVVYNFLALALLPEARRGLQTNLTSGPP